MSDQDGERAEVLQHNFAVSSEGLREQVIVPAPATGWEIGQIVDVEHIDGRRIRLQVKGWRVLQKGGRFPPDVEVELGPISAGP